MADQKVSDLPSLNGADVDPADLLYIIDSSAGSTGSKKITVGQYQLAPVSGGTANGVVYLNGSKVVTTGSALVFDGANLGLGVTPSAWGSGFTALQVKSGGSSLWSDGLQRLFLSANLYYDGTNRRYQTTGVATEYVQNSGQHVWYTAPSGTAGNAITFTQAMTLTSGGDLLVGQVGTGPLNIDGVAIGPANTGGIDYNHLNGTASGIMYARFNLNATTIGSITQSGTTAVLYNTTSDARLKTNIVDAPEASELIDSIKVRSFDWVNDESHQRYGMVAQELVQVAPEAVHQPEDPEAMMAVDYSKLVPMLIKEIQSLRARVAALESA